MDLTPIVAQYQIPASLLKSPPTIPTPEADPPPSPWLRQMGANLRYVWKAASVWIFAVLGVLAGIELINPDLIGHPWDHWITALLAALGPFATAAPQVIGKKEV